MGSLSVMMCTYLTSSLEVLHHASRNRAVLPLWRWVTHLREVGRQSHPLQISSLDFAGTQLCRKPAYIPLWGWIQHHLYLWSHPDLLASMLFGAGDMSCSSWAIESRARNDGCSCFRSKISPVVQCLFQLSNVDFVLSQLVPEWTHVS